MNRVFSCLGILSLTVLPILAWPIPDASADVVILAEEGRVAGSVDEVLIRKGDIEKRYLAGQFTGITLCKETPDRVCLADKTVVEGELISVRLKSQAGFLTFKRPEIKEILIDNYPISEIRKEYLERKSKIKDDDADGFYELAVWCHEKGLKMEARELARLCLEANPRPETAVFAHRVLGHVLRNGEWVNPATPEEIKESQQPIVIPVRTKPDSGTTAAAATPADLVKKLLAEYTQKANQLKTQDRDAVRKTYEADWQKLGKDVEKLEKDVETARSIKERISDELASQLRHYTDATAYANWLRQDRIAELRRDYDRASDRLSKAEAALDKAKRDQAQMRAKITAAMTKARERASTREEKLDIAQSKLDRLLAAGSKPTEAEIRAVLDEALK